jgi:hypothetical protein
MRGDQLTFSRSGLVRLEAHWLDLKFAENERKTHEAIQTGVGNCGALLVLVLIAAVVMPKQARLRTGR